MNELSSSLFVRSINPTKIPCCFRSAELGVLKQKSVERMAEGGKNKSEIEKRERKERERERERERGGGRKGKFNGKTTCEYRVAIFRGFLLETA